MEVNKDLTNQVAVEDNEPGVFPSERPRQVIETHNLLRAKIAGEVANPITKVNLQNNDVYVRPIKNTYQRPISPEVLSSQGALSIKGERQLNLGGFQDQIKAKAQLPITREQPVETRKEQAPISPEDQNYNQQIKRQLDEINKVLFEQIKQKVADELKRQEKTQQTPTVQNQQTLSQTPNLPYSKPLAVKTEPAKETKKEPEKQVIKTQVESKTEPSQEDYLKHIKILEEEIKHLVKEVEDLDKAFAIAKNPADSKELHSLEERLNTDEHVLRTAENWRKALTNLINSHSIALKHLKSKTDWLEEKTEGKHPHHQKHETHHRPKNEPDFDFPKIKKTPEIKLPEPTTTPTPVTVETKTEPKPQAPAAPVAPSQPIPVIVVENKTSETPLMKEPTLAQKPAPEVGAKTFENVRDMLAKIAEKDMVPPPITEAEKIETEINKPAAEADTGQLAPRPKIAISADDLKPQFDQLKTKLTTIDTKELAQLNPEQRKQMLQKLEQLEKDSNVLRQFDEIRATQEKRRINDELRKMFSSLSSPVQPTVAPTTNDEARSKIENLKQEEKKYSKPEDKARVIAEIRELERQAQLKKEKEQPKPVVKAQPAYGKMLPNTPTIPNVINGIVKDTSGLLLSGVVIIVKNKNNEPVRAFRPNKLGQFALSTPLPNGVYTLELEKEGYEFDIIEVTCDGSIMKPIEIRAKVSAN